MYVVTVNFSVHLSHLTEFMAAMRRNARDSLALEPGCLRFDVCDSGHEDGTVFLYEVYESREDFELHLAADHFLSFASVTSTWVREKQVVTYRLLSPIAPSTTDDYHG
jgi:autoinducer 2-degrading protein